MDQATDIAGFSALRAAYDDATRRMTTAAKRAPAPPLPDAPPPAVAAPALPLPPTPVHPEPVSPLEPPPVDTAPVDTAAQRDAAFAALLARLQTHSTITHLGDRIIAALADPVAQDPAYDTTLRRTIAAMLRNQLQPDGDNGLYLSSSLRGAVQALDKRYQWLSDYTAYRRDFWDQPFLLDAMMACAGFKTKSPPTRTPLPKPETVLEKTAALTKSYTFWGGLAVLVSMAMITEHLKHAHLQGPI